MPDMTQIDLRFSMAMTRLGVQPSTRIAIAVSGGPDSMALLALMRRWAADKAQLVVLTVDHALRDASRTEAEMVAQWCATQKIEHHILTWQGNKPSSHLQEEARHARYALLTQACHNHGIDMLALAHQAEDQMETFWMRLAHGSGLDGLAGMAQKREQGGINVIRPLLGFMRSELRDLCHALDMPFVDDPSNRDDKFLRVRLRAVEKVLADEGLTAQRLAQVIQKLEDARESLRFFEEAAAASCMDVYRDGGFAKMDLAAYLRYPRDMRRRLLSRVISFAAPQDYPLPQTQLDDLDARLNAAGFKGMTLGGAEIFMVGNHVTFCREAAFVKAQLVNGAETIWDRRYLFVCDQDVAGLRIDILGESGVAFLRKKEISLPQDIPYKILCSLPTVWRDDKPVFIQMLGYADASFGISGSALQLLPSIIV